MVQFLKARPSIWALLVVLLAGTILLYTRPVKFSQHLGEVGQTVPTPFRVILQARDLIHHDLSPYQPNEPLSYKYAPGILVPFKLLPANPNSAWILYTTLSILAWMAALLLGGGQWTYPTVGLLILGILLSWSGLTESLDQGYVDVLVFALAVFGAYFVNRVPLLAGLIIGGLVWVKLPWVVLYIPFILVVSRKKRWRLAQFSMGYFLSGFLWGAAIPNITFGSDRSMVFSRQWLALLKAQGDFLFFNDQNQSLWLSMQRWLDDQSVYAYGIAAVFLGILLGRMVSRSNEVRPNGGELAWISPWLILAQLINPLAWKWASLFVVGVPLSFSQGRWISNRFSRAGLYLIVGILFFGLTPEESRLGYGVQTVEWLLLLLLCL